MKKRVGILLLIMAMLISITGCAAVRQILIGGVEEGKLNTVYKTEWFNFEVKSVTVSNEYADYQTDEGYKFVIFRIWEKCTFDETIPMFPEDFLLEGEGLTQDDTYPYSADDFDGYAECMPYQFTLYPQSESTEVMKNEAEYDVVYTIPIDINEVTLVFTEISDEEKEGATFRIPCVLPEETF
jgi:hypothetical protein